jgi:hypothetical protein
VRVLTDLTPGEWALLDAFEDDVYEVRPVGVRGFASSRDPLAYTLPDGADGYPTWDRSALEAVLPDYVAACARFADRWHASRP